MNDDVRPLPLVVHFHDINVAVRVRERSMYLDDQVEPNQLATRMGAGAVAQGAQRHDGPVVVGLFTQVYGVRVGFVTCGALGLMLLIGLIRMLT
jgi:hypothetical protein